MRRCLILYCLSACQLINGQSSLPSFGDYSPEEINLKECSFDKNADAIILLDEAVSDHDDEYQLITRRRIRIKIFNQHETERGTIRIRFLSRGQFEYISDIRGISFNQEAGGPIVSYLDKKSIYTEKEDNIFSSIKFALPNVRPGTIIEYEYKSTMKNYGGLSSWEFQNDIPTLKSCYFLTLLPNRQFQYSVQKKTTYPIVIKPIPDQGKIYFEMNNIPGLKFEPYMDAARDYLQKVEFQLAGVTLWTGGTIKVNQTWKDLAYDLATDRDFGGVIKKDLSKTDEVKNLVGKETTDSGKIAAIYYFVRNNFEWNGYYAVYAGEGLKNVWEKRKGTAAEINLLLINLLQTFNIEVYPLLVAERKYGKIDTAYPFLDRFNKVAAYALAGGKTFIMDATQKYSAPGLTPFSLLNTIAFLIDKKKYRLIRIQSGGDAYKNVITATAKVDNKGHLSGTTVIESSGYAKQLRTEKARTDVKKFIKDILQDPGSEIVVDNCEFGNLDIDSGALVQNIEFHNELDVSGGFIFLTYNLFTGFVKNPFTANERFTNINFGYPYDITLQVNLQLPDKCKIDKLPADKTIISSDNTTSATRKLRIENNVLVASIKFWQNITLVSYDYYDTVKSLYKQIVDMLNEPVVIKVEN